MSKFGKLSVTRQTFSKTVLILKKKFIELTCARRNNLIVHGITEEDNETTVTLKQKVVQEIFENRLGVTVSSIERIHRLGPKRLNKDRPIIMKFADYNEKIGVFRQCRKLKGTRISIADDYSEKTVRLKGESSSGKVRKPKGKMAQKLSCFMMDFR